MQHIQAHDRINFLKNGNSKNVINEWFKDYVNNISVARETTLTVEKKPVLIFPPSLGSIFL